VTLDLLEVKTEGVSRAEEVLFSESQSRFLCEVPVDRVADFEANLYDVPFARIGAFTDAHRDWVVTRGGTELARVPMADLLRAFKGTLDFDGTLTEDLR
jgi:phosphoribosylformylglycinamidine synthase subunit PurSL